MNNKDQHTEVSCERMVNKNKSSQKSEMIHYHYGLVRQREIVLFADIHPSNLTPEKEDIGPISRCAVIGYLIIIILYTYLTIYLYNLFLEIIK